MISKDELQEIMCDKELTDSLERASFIHGFRTAEKIYTKYDENCDSEKTSYSVKIGFYSKHESE